MAIEEVVTAPRSPWQNAYVERIIGSIRRECLDHIIIFDERHLRRMLSARASAHTDTVYRYRYRLPAGRWPAPSLRASRSLASRRVQG